MESDALVCKQTVAQALLCTTRHINTPPQSETELYCLSSNLTHNCLSESRLELLTVGFKIRKMFKPQTLHSQRLCG